MSERFFHTPSGAFSIALRAQGRVIRALMLRQAIARFGRDNLGIFWIFAEPLILSGAVMMIWTIMGLHKGQGVGIVPFVLVTYSLLTLWRHLVGSSVRALRANSELLYHRHIRLIDILTARASLESLAGFAAFTVAYVVLNIFGIVRDVHDPLVLVGAWLLMTWFGWSFGLLVAAVTELFEVAEHFVQPFMYATLPVTGAFYMVMWLPQSAQDALMWSPLVHMFEMIRGGMLGSNFGPNWSVAYVSCWCFAMMALGLPLLRLAQHRFTAG